MEKMIFIRPTDVTMGMAIMQIPKIQLNQYRELGWIPTPRKVAKRFFRDRKKALQQLERANVIATYGKDKRANKIREVLDEVGFKYKRAASSYVAPAPAWYKVLWVKLTTWLRTLLTNK